MTLGTCDCRRKQVRCAAGAGRPGSFLVDAAFVAWCVTVNSLYCTRPYPGFRYCAFILFLPDTTHSHIHCAVSEHPSSLHLYPLGQTGVQEFRARRFATSRLRRSRSRLAIRNPAGRGGRTPHHPHFASLSTIRHDTTRHDTALLSSPVQHSTCGGGYWG
jgi:hypothetical protein